MEYPTEGRIVEITKDGKKMFKVLTMDGRNMGVYKTRKEAEKRLKQLEMFKHIKDNK